MSDQRTGVLLGVGAYAVWGLSPLFWNLVDGVATSDLLLHRILWSVPILAVVIALARQWPAVRALVTDRRRMAWTAGAAGLLFTNWAVFLWAVTNDRVVEASLGYFINPLVSVALGVVVLHERLRTAQWWAVGIAGTGVLWLTLRVGTVPWVSLVLAASFGVYGLLKKREGSSPATVSLFGEVSIIAIPGIALLALVPDAGTVGFFDSVPVAVFLVGAGAITVLPLVLFGAAAKRIPLSTIGLLQYLAPTLQFLIGVAVYGEELGTDRLIGFLFVWAALIVYSVDGFQASRSQVSPSPV
jgi:chloramphenicol-sensitive protein RarD